MKFINIRTGNIFNSIEELFDSLCNGVGCYFCKMAAIGNKEKCKEWAQLNKEMFLFGTDCMEVQDKSCYTCACWERGPMCRFNICKEKGCDNWIERK
jgi:hypothetical protein